MRLQVLSVPCEFRVPDRYECSYRASAGFGCLTSFLIGVVPFVEFKSMKIVVNISAQQSL